jgi:hypothetical protein
VWMLVVPIAQDFGNGSVLVKAFFTRLQSPQKQEFCFPTCPLPFFTPARNWVLGAHASVRGQRLAANLMLVRCNSDVPIS